MRRLVGFDPVLVGEGASDVVEPVQQAVALEGIEVERDLAACRVHDQLPLEVDLREGATADRVDQRAAEPARLERVQAGERS